MFGVYFFLRKAIYIYMHIYMVLFFCVHHIYIYIYYLSYDIQKFYRQTEAVNTFVWNFLVLITYGA